MGRGKNTDSSNGHVARHTARSYVESRFGRELAQLPVRDRYRLGDVGCQVLRVLGVSSPIERWQLPRAQSLLGEAFELVRAQGLGSAMKRDGLRSVASIRERLLDLAASSGPYDTDLDRALVEFQVEAAASRTAELDWLAANLNFAVVAQPEQTELEARRAALARLWFDSL